MFVGSGLSKAASSDFPDWPELVEPLRIEAGMAMVGIGPEASAKRQETVYRILDTLTVESPPNGPAA